MVLKGLALGGAIAAVAVAILVALTFQPSRTTVTTPANNVMVLPNGVAVPQLQPGTQGAPVLLDNTIDLNAPASVTFDQAAVAAPAVNADASAAGAAAKEQALVGASCAGK